MVGCLPGLSMRRIADLSPGSAKTDKRDAAAIAQTATTMLHTLRAISTSDDDTAALSILTGFDLDLARQVSQTANHIRGQCAPRSTRPRGRPGTPPRARRLLGDHSGLAHPHRTRTEEGRQSTYRCQAEEARCPGPHRLGPTDMRCPGQTDRHRSGTDAAGAALPHLARQLIALHTQRADITAQVEALSCQVLTTRAQHRGPERRRIPD